MNQRARDPIDTHVGQRLRLRRTMAGMSQERLGEAIGVSFQMVQKYERGDCRVGASRLMKISGALNVPIAFFFEGFAGAKPDSLLVAEDKNTLDEKVFQSKESIELLKAYYALPEAVRKHVLGMVKGLEKDNQQG
ncbi:MAG: XRE family transcriptional regulator [Alphaproteobacteria bacterium]|nr:MAG: XRE family transcriptional regulator [Alphaproteobacteria bacterium]